MKYLIILSLLFAGCSTPRHLVNTNLCESMGSGYFDCQKKNAVQKLK